MADEITITTGLSLINGSLRADRKATSTRFDQTTARGGGPGTVDVGTSEGAIDFGDIVPGWVEMINLDPDNFVQVGFSTGVYGFRLPPAGGAAVFYLESAATVYAKADTAGCKVQVIAANS
jgi:hypothetical protein